MTQHEKKQNTNIPSSDITQSVLHRIDAEHVGQTPRAYFLCAEYGVWALWVLSVGIGAVAFSILIFFSVHAPLALYEVTHEGWFEFFLDIMPYAWVGVFIAMAVLAHYNLRHTKRGYRYEVWQVLASSLFASFLGGVVLHFLGVSFFIDSFITQRVPALPALQRFETHMWQAPQHGRMIGSIEEATGTGAYVQFKDADGTLWNLSVSELSPDDIDVLQSGKKVRLIGVPSSTDMHSFIGCGVFANNPDVYRSIAESKAEKDRFNARIRLHHEAMRALQASTSIAEKEELIETLCAQNPTIKRMYRPRKP